MSDPRRPEQTRAYRPGGQPTEPLRQPYPPYNDPAYAGHSQYYQGSSPGRTERLPRYWPEGVPPPDQDMQEHFSPSGRPKSPRWLWIAAGAAVLLVVALVIALLLANGSARKQTTVAPLPGVSGKSATPSASAPASTSAPGAGTASPSTETTSADGTDSVVYTVNGEGRAISITFVDTGGTMQTEFNVELPWSKEVRLAKDDRKPNITIVNIGNNLTCTVTVGGAQVRQQTGVGLTICTAPS